MSEETTLRPPPGLAKAAAQNVTAAQTALGVLYHQGLGVENDEAEAMRWFRKAADQNDAWGQVEVGNLYENGEGVERNYTEALRWYRMAANQNLDRAKRNLRGLCMRRMDLPQDYRDLTEEAQRWCRSASE
jgi:TPR repeat protein